ncbi:hypothetical protein ACFLVU_01795 [Chloroflexota bacterium]
MLHKIFHLIPNILGERRYLKGVWKKDFSTLAGCEVYFISRGFNGIKYYLLKRLSKRNRLVYVVPKSPISMSKYTPVNIVDLAKLIVFKVIYGFDAALGKISLVRGFLWINDRFMSKSVHRIVDGYERDRIIEDFDYHRFQIFKTGGYSIVYFDDNAIEAGYLKDIDTYKKELADIFNLLNKYIPKDKIAYKYHPGYSGDTLLFGDYRMLPSYIPAELLYSDHIKIYLSIFSTSITQIKRGLAISVADLVSFKNDETKEKKKEELIKVSKSKIIFPKSLDELEQILINNMS